MIKDYHCLSKTNVQGTLEVLRLCYDKHVKVLHYASTLSVFVSSDNNTGVCFETDRLDTPISIFMEGMRKQSGCLEKYF